MSSSEFSSFFDSPADKHENHLGPGGSTRRPIVLDPASVSADETTQAEIQTPTAIAAAAADRLSLGFSNMLAGCVIIFDFFERFENDTTAVREFCMELSRWHFITANDVARGTGSSKVSKLRLIGEYAGVLRNPKLLPKLDRGYTVAYKYAHEIKYQPGKTQEERLERVLNKMRNKEERLARKIHEKKAAAAKRSEAAAEWRATNKTGTLNPRCYPEIAANVILITPDAQQLKDLDTPKIRFAKIGELAEDVVGVVVTTLRSLPGVFRPLQEAGFKYIQHYLLTEQPVGPDIRGAQVVVIALYSGAAAKRIEKLEFTWLDQPVDDWRKVVERWIPDAGHKRHAYALESAEGWECVDGFFDTD